MAGTIRITPQELKDASTYLGQRLDAISTEATSLKSKLDEIGANWEGAARTTFFDIFETDMWPVLSKNLPELIEGIMAQLNGTAEGLDKADFEISQKLRG
jgi:WXG100 family type VII secretion target